MAKLVKIRKVPKTQKSLLSFTYTVKANSEIELLLDYQIGHEDKVTEFLIRLTNNDIYGACLIDLNMQAEQDPSLNESVSKILNGIKDKLIETLDTPILKPSQVFRGRN